MEKNKTFEEKMERLEKIVNLLEDTSLGLNQAMELYEEAMNLSKELNTELNDISNKITKLVENGKETDF